MQERPADLQSLIHEQSTTLCFPTLHDEANLGDCLARSTLGAAVPPATMAFPADDSSVDGTLSSVGESTWDLIDEGSVASDDAPAALLPPSSAAGDGMESVHVTGDSFIRGDDLKSVTTDGSGLDGLTPPSASSEDANSPRMVSRTAARSMASPSQSMHDSRAQDWPGTIRVTETSGVDPISGIRHASVPVRTFDYETACASAFPFKEAQRVTPLHGRVHMGLKDGGLEIKDTFRLLYYGPKEMKSDITQKIGSALAANPRRPLLTEGPASSRVTVVPISSIVDESSPEVVMIESGGFDMIIEDLVAASRTEKGGIMLRVESGNTIEQWTEHGEGEKKYRISAPTGVPSLGIIYLPYKSRANMRNSYHLQHFFRQCGIPFYVITETNWMNRLPPPRSVDFDVVIPHLSVEALIDGKLCSSHRIPIDIGTFLSLDASQLHQNIVAAISYSKHAIQQIRSKQTALQIQRQDWRRLTAAKLRTEIGRLRELSSRTWLHVAVAMLVFSLIFSGLSFRNTKARTSLESAPINILPAPTGLPSISRVSTSKQNVNLQVIPTAKALSQLFDGETARTLPHSSKHRKNQNADTTTSTTNKHRVLVKVVGQSHILIRSSRPGRGADSLRFQSTRNGKLLEHELQRIDDEYSVLEIPPADAYGEIEIRIWSGGKFAYNETFVIDLGFPWFKYKGWKELAGEAAEKTWTEAQAMGTGLRKTFEEGRTRLDEMRNSKKIANALESLGASLEELERAMQTKSTRLFRRNIRRIARAKKRLSKLAKGIKKSSSRQSQLALQQQARINAELKELARILSENWFQQRQKFRHLLADLQDTAEARHKPFRKGKHVRRLQKQVLRAWWKVRGRPHNMP